jgi:GH24 family phage-related lysozyme (muramidase)
MIMADVNQSILIALDFTKKWEGLASTNKIKPTYFANPNNVKPDTLIYSYPDADNYSIGWGTYANLNDGTPISANTYITKKRADFELIAEMQNVAKEIAKQIDISTLTNNQFAAILDYGYNAGSYALNRNGLLDVIKAKGNVANALKNASITIKGTGKVSTNLKNRRIDEGKLYNGTYNALYSAYLRHSNIANFIMFALVAFVGYKAIKKIN